jgi:hypothetical protein
MLIAREPQPRLLRFPFGEHLQMIDLPRREAGPRQAPDSKVCSTALVLSSFHVSCSTGCITLDPAMMDSGAKSQSRTKINDHREKKGKNATIEGFASYFITATNPFD